jgi:cell division protein FtsQ
MSTLIRASDRPAPPRGGRRTKPSAKKVTPVRGKARGRDRGRPPVAPRRTGRIVAVSAGLAGLVVILALVMSGAPGRAWASLTDGLDRLAIDSGFAITSVTVSGRDATPTDAILAAVGVKYGEPMLGFDADAARERIEKLASVGSASVIRRLPNEIHVAIVERVPFARWQIDGQRYVIDQEGNVITGRKVENYAGLTEIVGVGAPKAVKELVAVYKSDPELAARVEAAVRIGERRWNIHFSNGVVVRFPEADFAGAWLQLSRLEADKQILDRAVDYVDLRVKDKIFIRPASGESAPSGGKNTSRGAALGTVG